IKVCPTCKSMNPVCLVNRPCRHVTSCVHCQGQSTKCIVCKRIIQIVQTEFDLQRQESC
ncbi:hypothetical protein BgiMline_021011, partial [Biomphalaria glabrata]